MAHPPVCPTPHRAWPWHTAAAGWLTVLQSLLLGSSGPRHSPESGSRPPPADGLHCRLHVSPSLGQNSARHLLGKEIKGDLSGHWRGLLCLGEMSQTWNSLPLSLLPFFGCLSLSCLHTTGARVCAGMGKLGPNISRREKTLIGPGKDLGSRPSTGAGCLPAGAGGPRPGTQLTEK